MTRIVNNIASLVAQQNLGKQNRALGVSLSRLSTGLKINRAADSPDGLIASENLRAEKTAIEQAIQNGERAEKVINIAEGGLVEIQDQLRELLGLVGSAASPGGLDRREKEAIQLQVDSILASIDRISNQTTFQGTKLLNGNFEFLTSGVIASQFDDVDVRAALLPAGPQIGPDGAVLPASTIIMEILVAASAQHAMMMISAGPNGFSGQTVTYEITGNNGTTQFAFNSGTTASQAAMSINQFVEITGVSASVSTNPGGADAVFLRSRGLGQEQFVSVRLVEGSAYETSIYKHDNTGLSIPNPALAGTMGESFVRDLGRDADISINGIEANTRGLVASIARQELNVQFKLDSRFNTTTDAATGFANSTSFVIHTGGMKFNLSPRSELSGKARIGIRGVSTGSLGSFENGRLAVIKSGGTANLIDGDIDRAQRIVDDAIRQISVERGQLGAFVTNAVRTSINALGVALENTTSAESSIRDTDFAHETAELTRRQILSQAATNALAIANAQSQNVLSLLG